MQGATGKRYSASRIRRILAAAALGIDAVLVTPSCHDPLYRRAARVSMGTVFQVPWTRIGSVRDWAAEGVPLLRSLGFVTAALALSDDAIYLHDARLHDCERLALVLGTEGDGLAASVGDDCLRFEGGELSLDGDQDDME